MWAQDGRGASAAKADAVATPRSRARQLGEAVCSENRTRVFAGRAAGRHVDHALRLAAQAQLAHGIDEVLLRRVVDVALQERRGIEAVEELTRLASLELDEMLSAFARVDR